MILGVFVLALLLVAGGWVTYRRRRAGVLAGLSSDKPTFQVSPPRRSLGKRSTECL